MYLYHGSNMLVDHPKLLLNQRALDFGAGFYLTSSRDQASRWAKTVTRRRNSGDALINVYTFKDEKLEELMVLRFDTADSEWLDYVVRNRKGTAAETAYDIVIGPVANDSTLPVIDDYMSGVYTKEEAVKRLLPQKLTDQYAFLTEKAINCLIFEKGEPI
ncbi:MAG: DUF3990 domain-containing protein [Lachnospiraceae bacterium]|nr:DUF3990 domain-containing protein [Lachnospiraceae bacterium]